MTVVRSQIKQVTGRNNDHASACPQIAIRIAHDPAIWHHPTLGCRILGKRQEGGDKLRPYRELSGVGAFMVSARVLGGGCSSGPPAENRRG